MKWVQIPKGLLILMFSFIFQVFVGAWNSTTEAWELRSQFIFLLHGLSCLFSQQTLFEKVVFFFFFNFRSAEVFYHDLGSKHETASLLTVKSAMMRMIIWPFATFFIHLSSKVQWSFWATGQLAKEKSTVDWQKFQLHISYFFKLRAASFLIEGI